MATDVAIKLDTAKPAFHLIDRGFERTVIIDISPIHNPRPEDYLDTWLPNGDDSSYDSIALAFRDVAAMYVTDNPKHVARMELARVLNFGASKYSANNWRKGFAWSRLWRAAYGHIQQHRAGNLYDDGEGGAGGMHLGNALCMLMMLYVHQRDGLGVDDRAEVWPSAPDEAVQPVGVTVQPVPGYLS